MENAETVSEEYREGPPRVFQPIPCRCALQWEGWFEVREVRAEMAADCNYSRDGIKLLTGDCITLMDAMEPDSVDLVFGSPPYCDARTYGIGAQRNCVQWVEWMLEVTTAAARICKGPVIWVAAGVTRKRNYWPACEGLMWEWWKLGGTHELYRPCIYHRVGIPGSGGKDWFRADTEYVMCFKRPGILPWADNTACGHTPKWAPGGAMSHRLTDGTRRNHWGGTEGSTGMRRANGSRRTNQWGHSTESATCGARTKNGTRVKKFRPSHRMGTKTRANGDTEVQTYAEPVKANPGNLVHCKVGGGLMGHKLAHENEAPFPETLAERFVLSCCPPNGIVLDPFSGSGTTMAVAFKNNRRGIGIDIRESQTTLAATRLTDICLPMFSQSVVASDT